MDPICKFVGTTDNRGLTRPLFTLTKSGLWAEEACFFCLAIGGETEQTRNLGGGTLDLYKKDLSKAV